MNLSKNVKITKLAAYASANTTDVTGTVLDMSGFDGVLIFAAVNVANAGNYLKVQQSSDNAVADAFADLEGSKVVVGKTDQVVGIDIYRPLERYLKAIIVRGASTTSGELFAVQYSGSKCPVDNLDATGDMNIETSISPAEGTA